MPQLRSITELEKIPGPLALGIGVFDGVHLGHRAVIEATIKTAAEKGGTPVIVTFDPHPMRILRPENPPRLLTSTTHKLKLLAERGVEHVLLVEFDHSFAAQSPGEFIRSLASHSRPLTAVCVGQDWAFGRGRSGDVAFLRSLGVELDFSVVAVPPVIVENQIVSSTLIRHAVENGDLALASKYLGRPYTILGTVVEGKKLGRTIGFPTANLAAHNEQFPPNGVYAVTASVHGIPHPGVANIGFRPSVENATPGRLLEVHLLDFRENLYGLDLEIVFNKFLRPEQKFDSLDALREQITKDVAIARVQQA